MYRLRTAVAAVVFGSMMLSSTGAFADMYRHHPEWRHGGHIDHRDWERGHRVDYRHDHLRPPPRGYEWREVDGNYVLAAIATGVIASVIAAGH